MEEWGQPLVIDLSWFKTMQLQQQKSLCLRELPYSTSYNKSSIQPFHLHYTGVQDPKIKTLMKKVDPQLMSDERPEVYTEQSYLDIFPKENIVYLSPDSRNELKWDDEDVYVIGGLVDVDLKSNASLGKDYNIDGQNAPLIFFEKKGTGGGNQGPQITSRRWIFLEHDFYHLKKFTPKSI